MIPQRQTNHCSAVLCAVVRDVLIETAPGLGRYVDR
eukprot:COSAG03_NODE_28995_length_191_cov_126.130435_2_plen_35_part_01